MKHIIIAVILIISNVFLGIGKPMKSQAEIYFCRRMFLGNRTLPETNERGRKYSGGICQQHRCQSRVMVPVCSGKRNAAETVKVVHDPEEVNLSFIAQPLFSDNRSDQPQPTGYYRGTQYRTGIYYINKSRSPHHQSGDPGISHSIQQTDCR